MERLLFHSPLLVWVVVADAVLARLASKEREDEGEKERRREGEGERYNKKRGDEMQRMTKNHRAARKEECSQMKLTT